jgi:hypothetical protein
MSHEGSATVPVTAGRIAEVAVALQLERDAQQIDRPFQLPTMALADSPRYVNVELGVRGRAPPVVHPIGLPSGAQRDHLARVGAKMPYGLARAK